MLSENINWTPVPNPQCDSTANHIPTELISIGYERGDEFRDADWIEQLALRNPMEFQHLTGYRIPDRLACNECGNCIPRIEETLVDDSQGNQVRSMTIICNSSYKMSSDDVVIDTQSSNNLGDNKEIDTDDTDPNENSASSCTNDNSHEDDPEYSGSSHH